MFDGPATAVNEQVLSQIYGAEDWSAITQKMQVVASTNSSEAEATALRLGTAQD